MSNSASWGFTRPWLDRTPEPQTRAINMNQLGRVLTEPPDPPVNLLFVYNCNPAATMPDQTRVLKGLAREDLFTVVFEQVMTDTALLADVVLPATTFLEGYDFSRAYGPISLQLSRPVIDPVAEARSNADVFADLGSRLGLWDDDEAAVRARHAAHDSQRAAARVRLAATRLRRRHAALGRRARAVCGRLPAHGRSKSALVPSGALTRKRRLAFMAIRRTPAVRSFRSRSSLPPPNARSAPLWANFHARK